MNTHAVSPDRAHVVNVITPSLMVKADIGAIIQWTPEDIIPTYIPESFSRSVDVNVLMFYQNYKQDKDSNWQVDWIPVEEGLEKIPLSSGETIFKFPKVTSDCILPLHNRASFVTSSICPIIIKVSVSESSGNSELLLPSNIGVWSGVYYLNNENRHLSVECSDWDTKEMKSLVSGPNLLNMVAACPPTELLARNDRDYQIEEMTSLFRKTNFNQTFMEFFHSGIECCYRQST